MSEGTALLVIDMQVAIAAEAYRRDEVLAAIGGLLERARNAGTPVIYIQHESQGWEPMQRGAEGWRIHQAIAPLLGELVIHKQASDSFSGTTLQQELATRGVKHLVVTGMMTEGCVDSTCRRALGLGYNITLAGDAHTTWDNILPAAQIIAHHNATLADIPYPGNTLNVQPAAEIAL